MKKKSTNQDGAIFGVGDILSDAVRNYRSVWKKIGPNYSVISCEITRITDTQINKLKTNDCVGLEEKWRTCLCLCELSC